MKPFINGSIATLLAIFGAALFVGVSASQNILNGWQLGRPTSELHATIFAVGGLACAIFQPIGWYAAHRAFGRGHNGRGTVAAFLAVACLFYASLSSLAFVSTARTDGTAVRAKAADTYQLANERASIALTELRSINSAPKGNRRTEAQKAERRIQLETVIAGAEETLHGDTAPATGDPAAASLAAYASALGRPLTAEQINPWLTIAIVLFFETGAGLSLIVVRAIAMPDSAALLEVRKPAANSNDNAGENSIDGDDQPEPTPPGRPRGRPRIATPDSVVSRIRSNGGAVSGNLNSIGRVIGMPAKSSAHRILRELEAAGRLQIETTPDGTIVRLAS